jgi:hypothetical protein
MAFPFLSACAQGDALTIAWLNLWRDMQALSLLETNT